jgi:phenylalanyl-tRNA synthetase beta chain
MKVTLNWLKRHVDFDWNPEELKERLTMLGIEVEGVQKLGGEFENVVVAQVMTCDKHPNADKLSVCKVDDGKTQRQIVCGAKNFKVGDKVPLALPGCVIPTPAGSPPFVIKVGKLRGVESQGMMCSGEELGLSADASGLMILPADAKVGQPFAEFLGKKGGDVVYDLEITPNRPDLNSVIGIAREIAALTGNPLKWPELKPLVEVTPNANGQDISSQIRVRLEDAELCPRYTARVVRGVKVGPSPAWLKETLEKVGIRSISNVVDVTNFVMLESGQPLHAFDFHLIARNSPGELPVIVVRRAVEGEKFTTLDGQQRTLTNQMLVIADEVHAVALAGVMGGLNSEIKDTTVDVLVESACFQPQSIRATSKKLDLRSDASYRYERGSDVCICDWASRRAVDLILETAGGQAVAGVVDAFPKLHTAREITLRFEKTNALLGVDIPADQQIAFLKNLSLELLRVEGTVSATFRIPSFRVDLKREADLIEEVARIYGVDKIPSRAPACVAGSHPYDHTHNELAEARRLLTGLGLDETQGQTLLAEASAKLVCAEPVYLQNALSADMTVLRPSLLPGLLEALQRNLNRKNGDLAFFEIGRVFGLQKGQLAEERRVAVALTGLRAPGFWSGAERNALMDLYDLKGVLETFLEQFGLRGITYVRRPEPTPLFIESATIHLGKMSLGEMGQLQPVLAKRFDLRNGAFFAELNMDLLLARRNTARQFKSLSQFPSVRRDVAMVVPEAVTHDAVLNAVKQAKVQNLDAVELFDVFRGQNVPEGHKSLAYAFTYRNTERTLTDAEVNSAHIKLVEQFKSGLQAVVREG